MTSQISTGSMNVNYPLPGVNNSTQGFRDNFNSIKNNLDIAASEISQLQITSILKSALPGQTLDNNMANAVLSNVALRGARNTTHNLGNNLAGSVSIVVSDAPVQYGTVTSSISLGFQNWAPAGTQSNVQLILTIANSSATIILPTTVTDGATTLENYVGNGTGGQITVPAGVTRLHYNFTTTNCGNTIEIDPLNRPRTGGGGNATPAGSNSSIQWNDGGVLGGTSNLRWEDSNNRLVTGNIQVTGSVRGSLVPDSNIQYDLGTPTNRWRELYLSGNSLFLSNQVVSAISANGVSGVALSNVITNQLVANSLLIYELTELGFVQDVRILGGVANQFLQTDGQGHLSWSDSTYGRIPAMYFSAPITGPNQEFSNIFISSYSSNLDATVFVNGGLIEADQYIISGNVISITPTLASGSNVAIIQAFASEIVSPLVVVPQIQFVATVSANNTQYSNVFLSQYQSVDDMQVFLNGALLGGGFYTLDLYTLTVTTPVEVGDSIIVGKTWAANVSPASTAAGNSGYIQYNVGGALGANSQLTFDESTGVFSTTTVQGGIRTTTTPPTSSTSAGISGDIAYDGGYIYVCVADNIWKRAALSTW